ncbi:uncharacterized protein LOC107876913 [Capsicum annuum]|uniref:uncharacterized protein LOC107876913 n=1 Tax=Capsicum annuum TaxID=4072 RepID=UPI0007BF8062|nr:uncharacterized protein LOC107876913 [Capsicum annuum]
MERRVSNKMGEDDTVGNPGIGAYGFCLRNEEGDLLYGQGENIGHTTNIIVEMRAIHEEVRYYWEHNIRKLEVESDSLLLVKVINNVWKVSWEMVELLEDIQGLKEKIEIQVKHNFREGNLLGDFIANLAMDTNGEIIFNSFHQIQSKEEKS